MLDEDLALLYGVETKQLNRAVLRNSARFPLDFSFILTNQELRDLKFQSGTSSSAHGGRRKSTRAFTEQGVAMLSSVLRSARAAAVNVEIMRAFVRLREAASDFVELKQRLDEMEREYDVQFAEVFTALRALMDAEARRTAAPGKPRIGFRSD